MDNIYYIQSLFSAMPFSVSSEDDLDKLPACNLITQTTLVCAIYILQTSKVDCKPCFLSQSNICTMHASC